MDNKKKNNVNKPAAGAQKNATEEKSSFGFAFGPMNYILMIVGIMLLGLGYILLSGGGSDDPNGRDVQQPPYGCCTVDDCSRIGG